ncbi:MAG: hydratase, partial [Parvibaculaceae bacterium]
GAPVRDWRGLDLKAVPVQLRVNSRAERNGTGANVLGDPLEAFVWLVNARARDGEGLKAGHVHNTGTATSLYWSKPGDAFEADFGPLGIVRLRLT